MDKKTQCNQATTNQISTERDWFAVSSANQVLELESHDGEGPIYQIPTDNSLYEYVGDSSPDILNRPPLNCIAHNPQDYVLCHDRQEAVVFNGPLHGWIGYELGQAICPDMTKVLFLAGYFDPDHPCFHVYESGDSFLYTDYEIPENFKEAFLVKFWYESKRYDSITKIISKNFEAGNVLWTHWKSGEDEALSYGYAVIPVGGGIFLSEGRKKSQRNRAAKQQKLLANYRKLHIPHYYEADCFSDDISFRMSYVIDTDGALIRPTKKEDIKHEMPEFEIPFKKIATNDVHCIWDPIPPGAIVVQFEYDGINSVVVRMVHDIDAYTELQKRRLRLLNEDADEFIKEVEG